MNKKAVAMQDPAHYDEEMRKSMWDKLYFIHYPEIVKEINVFVDYGCGDGTLLHHLDSHLNKKKISNLVLIGYDSSQDMVTKADKLLMETGANHFGIFQRWDCSENNQNVCVQNALNLLKEAPDKKSALILSSVIHEVHAYGGQDEINEFWRRVWTTGFDYICIRDMMPSINAVRPSSDSKAKKVRDSYPDELLRQWEEIWGPLENNLSLLHFLLTYRYQANWERELVKNYFPFCIEGFLKTIPSTYGILMQNHYKLPFIEIKVWDDFRFFLDDPTHIQLILSRKREQQK